jgi:surface antigen
VWAWGDREECRRPLYSGTTALRLCGRWHKLSCVAAVLGAVAVSGCSYRLASLGSNDDGDPPTTGSVTAPARPSATGSGAAGADVTASVSPRSDADLAYARAAASDALARGGKDSSVPWQNPETGAGGNITPLATSYSEGGRPCRDFLASYVHGGSQDWLQGAACRSADGAWEVRRLKPLGHG